MATLRSRLPTLLHGSRIALAFTQRVAQALFGIDARHQHPIVHWHKPLQETMRRALVAKAHALGSF